MSPTMQHADRIEGFIRHEPDGTSWFTSKSVPRQDGDIPGALIVSRGLEFVPDEPDKCSAHPCVLGSRGYEQDVAGHPI